jgi:hypothetical protein
MVLQSTVDLPVDLVSLRSSSLAVARGAGLVISYDHGIRMVLIL